MENLERHDRRLAAKEFINFWQDKGDEKQDTQNFWRSLLVNIFGVEYVERTIDFEKRVKILNKNGNYSTKFIDAYIPETKVLIEQKSKNIDLNKKSAQSDEENLTPFEQAKRYANELKVSEKPRHIIVSNFEKFVIYDLDSEKPEETASEIYLKDLEKEYHRLEFIINKKAQQIKKEEEISFKAGELVGRLYSNLAKQYKDISNPDSLKSLNELCVRIVFCLYAEDSGLFGAKNAFHNYLAGFSELSHMRKGLIELFEVLDTPPEKRDAYLDESLAQFPYINGGLFANENLEIPNFTEEIKNTILQKASEDFDWSEISPTIFGAVFESTLNPETRRSGGMHYTSIENIHKVIDPLFLDDLKAELEKIKQVKVAKTRTEKAHNFTEKLSKLTFLDPACGSGNFLTETFLSLRRLENEALEIIHKNQISMGFSGEMNPIKVSIKQFYGIEINDFAVATAKTALWIAEHQTARETADIIHQNIDFLPLKTYTNIKHANALTIDWNEVIPAENLNYIIGNPPFVGAMMMTRGQRLDMLHVFGKIKGIGELDFVGAWFYKAAEMMKNTNIRTALVSTNSITQGQQVAILWKPLFEYFGVHIDFAHKTFRWDNDASQKAAVHVVIIGFSVAPNRQPKRLFDGDSFEVVKNINGYLKDAPDVFIENRSKPIIEYMPPMNFGNMPRDGGGFILTAEEKEDFIKENPLSEKYIHPYIGAAEFINNKERYCLWLVDCPPHELKQMPKVLERVNFIKEFRLKSKAEGTRKLAQTPTYFAQITQPVGQEFIMVPSVSSEKRFYVPIGFLSGDVIASNAVQIIPNATLYHFAILTSSVHMAWMRAVAGRLKSDYRYSKDIVYNNFIWPVVSKDLEEKLAASAQKILDARAKYPDSTLADLYNELTMPVDLRKAHQENDKAVLRAYGLPLNSTEEQIVAHLMKLYQEKVSEKNEL